MIINVGDTFACLWVDEEGNHCSLTYKVLEVQETPEKILTCQVT